MSLYNLFQGLSFTERNDIQLACTNEFAYWLKGLQTQRWLGIMEVIVKEAEDYGWDMEADIRECRRDMIQKRNL